MVDEEKELEKLKLKKMREMLRSQTEKREENQTASIKPVELTNVTFTKAIQTHPYVAVDCWAPWCGPCRMISPIIEELARDYAGKIFFGKLNVDRNQQLAVQHRIMSIPTILVFQNGNLVDRIIGAMPRQILEPRITRYL